MSMYGSPPGIPATTQTVSVVLNEIIIEKSEGMLLEMEMFRHPGVFWMM